jgi:hypothetical protein
MSSGILIRHRCREGQKEAHRPRGRCRSDGPSRRDRAVASAERHFRGEVLLGLAANAIAWAGAGRGSSLTLELTREGFLPEFSRRSRDWRKLQYAVLAAAAVRSGLSRICSTRSPGRRPTISGSTRSWLRSCTYIRGLPAGLSDQFPARLSNGRARPVGTADWSRALAADLPERSPPASLADLSAGQLVPQRRGQVAAAPARRLRISTTVTRPGRPSPRPFQDRLGRRWRSRLVAM